MTEQIIPAPNTLEHIKITDTTVGLFDWAKEVVKFNSTDDANNFHSWIPVHAGEYLAPVLTGYMTGPVGIYDGRPIEARTVTIKDINEFRDNAGKWIAEGKKVFLYMPIWYPNQPVFKKLHPETLDQIDCDPIEWIESGWKIRYALLD